MNTLQKRIALLEYFGWIELADFGRRGAEGPMGALRGVGPGGTLRRIAPNPITNLNAVHDMIMMLSLDDQCEVCEILRGKVLMFKRPTITASAEELSEALGIHLKLWSNE